MEQPKRRFPFFAAILAVLLVSYTFVRLRHAADNLPYDPGPPWPTIEVDGTDDAKRFERLWSAILEGKSVHMPGLDIRDNDVVEAWPLRGIELERARRLLSEGLKTATDKPRDQRTRQDCWNLACLTAATALVEQDRAFVADAGMPAPADDRWQYWAIVLFDQNGHLRSLHVRIDKDEFPYVRRAATADPATFEPR